MTILWSILIILPVSLSWPGGTACAAGYGGGRCEPAPRRLYLLTVAPGERISEVWGHSALWFTDSRHQTDRVFEYVSTESDERAAALKTLFGHDRYRLRATGLAAFYRESGGRHVRLTPLPGDAAAIAAVYNRLTAVLQQHHTYAYRLAAANCSTLLLRHLMPLLQHRPAAAHLSLREVFRRDGQAGALAEWLILDLLSGAAADHLATAAVTPRALAAAFGAPAPTPPPSLAAYAGWGTAGLLLLALAAGFPNAFRTTLLAAAGLAGLLLLIVGWYTEEPLLQANYHLLWLNPAALVALPAGSGMRYGAAAVLTAAAAATLCIAISRGHTYPPYLLASGATVLAAALALAEPKLRPGRTKKMTP